MASLYLSVESTLCSFSCCRNLLMKSSAFASTSSSTSVATLSFIVAGRRASTSSFSACLKAEDFMLADFFIFAGSLSGISTTNGVVFVSGGSFFYVVGLIPFNGFLMGNVMCLVFLPENVVGGLGFKGGDFLGEVEKGVRHLGFKDLGGKGGVKIEKGIGICWRGDEDYGGNHNIEKNEEDSGSEPVVHGCQE
nr:hypothetical protein AT5G56985 [Ipomoea batatas]